MNQQRSRRFRAAQDAELKAKEEEELRKEFAKQVLKSNSKQSRFMSHHPRTSCEHLGHHIAPLAFHAQAPLYTQSGVLTVERLSAW